RQILFPDEIRKKVPAERTSKLAAALRGKRIGLEEGVKFGGGPCAGCKVFFIGSATCCTKTRSNGKPIRNCAFIWNVRLRSTPRPACLPKKRATPPCSNLAAWSN